MTARSSPRSIFKRLLLDLVRVNQRALNHGPLISRYPSYAGTATIVRLELVLDVDLLALFGQLLAAVEESDVDFIGVPEHEHDLVALICGQGADHIAVAEIVWAA